MARNKDSINPNAWNAARREKMKEHDCWNCGYFDHCDPRKPCRLKKIKEGD